MDADVERQVQEEVKKKKPMRTPAQEAATLKALEALKKRREDIAREKIMKQREKEDAAANNTPAPVPPPTPTPAPTPAPSAPEVVQEKPKRKPRKPKEKTQDLKQLLDQTLDEKLSKLLGNFSQSKSSNEVPVAKVEERSSSQKATPPPPPAAPAPAKKLTGHELLDRLLFG